MLSILIVDDEVSICDEIGGYLKRKGYAVRTSQSGEDALELICQEKPDIVLLDLFMPGMGGEATLEEIKVQFPNMPVIIITVDPHCDTALKLLKKGASDYFTKPFDYYLLEKILSTWKKISE